MFHHHILPSLLPPRDSSCLIYVIIKHPVIHHHCIHHSVTLLSLLFLSIHSPPSVQSSQSSHAILYALKCKVDAFKGISKSHFSIPPPLSYLPPISPSLLMLIPLQRYRMGELWTVLGVYEELVKQKVFSSPVFPYLLLSFPPWCTIFHSILMLPK